MDDLFRATANLTTALDLLGRRREAVDVAMTGIEASRSAGQEAIYGNFLRGNGANSLFLLGRWEESRRLGETALEWSPAGVNFVNAVSNLAIVEIESRADERAGSLLGRLLLELETVPDAQDWCRPTGPRLRSPFGGVISPTRGGRPSSAGSASARPRTGSSWRRWRRSPSSPTRPSSSTPANGATWRSWRPPANGRPGCWRKPRRRSPPRAWPGRSGHVARPTLTSPPPGRIGRVSRVATKRRPGMPSPGPGTGSRSRTRSPGPDGARPRRPGRRRRQTGPGGGAQTPPRRGPDRPAARRPTAPARARGARRAGAHHDPGGPRCLAGDVRRRGWRGVIGDVGPVVRSGAVPVGVAVGPGTGEPGAAAARASERSAGVGRIAREFVGPVRPRTEGFGLSPREKRGPPAHRRGPNEPRDRRAPVHQPEDRRGPCRQHPLEARRLRAGRGSRGRHPPRPDRPPLTVVRPLVRLAYQPTPDGHRRSEPDRSFARWSGWRTNRRRTGTGQPGARPAGSLVGPLVRLAYQPTPGRAPDPARRLARSPGGSPGVPTDARTGTGPGAPARSFARWSGWRTK